MNNSAYAINPHHFGNVGKEHDKTSRKSYHTITNRQLAPSAKRTGTQKDKGKPMIHVLHIL